MRPREWLLLSALLLAGSVACIVVARAVGSLAEHARLLAVALACAAAVPLGVVAAERMRG
jgi:Na+/H+ antiporter NhaC